MNVNTKKIALNAVCTGIVASIATKFLIGEVETVTYYGMSLPANISVGMGCAVGSVVSDLSSDMIIKRLAVTNQVMNGSTIAIQAGVGGLASGAVLYFGGAPMQNLPVAVGLGAVSKLGGDYIQVKLFDPRDGIIGPIF